MPYKTGSWGKKAIARSKKRLRYFSEYQKKHRERRREEYHRKYKRRFGGFGSLGEEIALKLLPNSELVRKPFFDIVWRKRKIEVKIAKFRQKVNGWSFNSGRQKNKTDYFLFICMAQDKQTIVKIFFIPDSFIPDKTGTFINLQSTKYEKFKIKRGDEK